MERTKETAESDAKADNGPESGPVVLIVDDEPRLRHLISEVLRRNYPQYRVEQATNGLVAAKKLLASPPALVILDLRLPLLSGMEICRLIKREPSLSKTRVLVITGYPTPDIYQDVYGQGADEFLPKPFDLEDLLERFRRLLV